MHILIPDCNAVVIPALTDLEVRAVGYHAEDYS